MKKLLVVVSMLLAACSGGGGGSTTSVPAAQKTVVGTASEGAPLTGTAYLKDSKGAETTSPIDAAGGFKFVVDNMTAPYILKAGTLYSFASAPGTVNINPFTDLSVKNASNVVDMAPVYGGTASALAPQLQAIQSKIQTAVDDLNTKIDQVYQKYGLTTVAQKNFMTGGITIGQGVDAMFDTFKVAIAANGTITMKTKTGDAPIFTASRNSTTGIMTITFDPNLTANMPATLVGAPVFTTSMLSGKSFSVDGGTITFNVDGTMSGVGINVAGGTWNINSSGQLIMTGSSKGTRTCTIVAGNATNGWTVNVVYASSTPSETMIFVPTTTPTANIFTTAILSGKSFTVVGSGTITFNANGTLSGVGINVAGETWAINTSGQLVINGTSKGTRTSTIVSGNAINGWSLSSTYTNGTADTMTMVPTTIPIPTASDVKIAVNGKSYNNTFALKNGNVYGWGTNHNNDNKLLDGTNVDKLTPSLISSLTGVKSIAVGSSSVVALKTDGTVFTWGSTLNTSGGSVSVATTLQPSQVSGLSGIKSIAGGDVSAFALKNDGTVWAWGENYNGQLGDGTTIDRAVPVQLTGISDVKSITSGASFTVALKNDGTVWQWGGVYTSDGVSFGNPTANLTTISTPTLVSGVSGITSIAAGGRFVIALKNDGTVWSWGYNDKGQLGAGTTAGRTTPAMVSGVSNVSTIAAGTQHVAVLKNDGTVWMWGYNFAGQLGDGTTTDRTTPAKVSSLSNIIDIGVGVHHTIAIKNDGTVWTFGDNRYGQLGNGNTANQSTPINVL